MSPEQRETYYATIKSRPLAIDWKRSRIDSLDRRRFERAPLAAIENRLREIGVSEPDIRQAMGR